MTNPPVVVIQQGEPNPNPPPPPSSPIQPVVVQAPPTPEMLDQAERLGRLTSENDSLRRELETERNKPAQIVEVQVPTPEPEELEPEPESGQAQLVPVPPEEPEGNGDAPLAPAPKAVNRGILAKLFLGT